MNSVKTFLEGHRSAVFALVAAGATGGVVLYFATKWGHAKRKLPTEWEEVGKISQLLIYPIKSAKAISVKSAEATKLGLTSGNLADRSFIIMTEDGSMVTGRQANMLVTMKTEFENDNLTITSLQGEKITVNIKAVISGNKEISKFKIRSDPVQGVDCGDEVGEWLSKRLYDDGTRLRLFYGGHEMWTRPGRKFEYFDFPLLEEEDTTVYYDATSYNLMTESSLRDLNDRVSSPVTVDFFRPSIVINGTSPFDEDGWEYVKIGHSVVLRVGKPCERCKMTTIDPSSGDTKKEHFDEMMKFRLVRHPSSLAKQWSTRPIFGLHCGIDQMGVVNVGDTVSVARDKSPYWSV